MKKVNISEELGKGIDLNELEEARKENEKINEDEQARRADQRQNEKDRIKKELQEGEPGEGDSRKQ